MRIAAIPENASTGVELLKIADSCRYESNASGRDRVTITPPPELPVEY
jgi:hypothetical protein